MNQMNQFAEISGNKAGGRPLKAAILLALAAVALVSLPAFATLGGNSASVSADQAVLQATMTRSAKAGYTDYALTLANGIIVHEFVNSANQVFEVTWNGKRMRPNMKQILGSYFSHFYPQQKEGQATSRRLDRVSTTVEIHSAVQNRLFSGTAHIPSMIPTSISGPLGVPVESATPGSAAAPN